MSILAGLLILIVPVVGILAEVYLVTLAFKLLGKMVEWMGSE